MAEPFALVVFVWCTKRWTVKTLRHLRPSLCIARLPGYSRWWSIDSWSFAAFCHSIQLPGGCTGRYGFESSTKRNIMYAAPSIPRTYLFDPKDWHQTCLQILCDIDLIDFLQKHIQLEPLRATNWISRMLSHSWFPPRRNAVKMLFTWIENEDIFYRFDVGEYQMLIFIWMHSPDRPILSGRSEHVRQCHDDRST